MKIRVGFVSNSSSSSFICDISGYDVSGWDLCLCDAGMYQCENSHTFLTEYLVGSEAEARITYIRKEEAKDTQWKDLEAEEFEYYIPAEHCPLCSFSTVSDKDMMKLLIKDSGKTRKELSAESKERFGTYEKLLQYIKD